MRAVHPSSSNSWSDFLEGDSGTVGPLEATISLNLAKGSPATCLRRRGVADRYKFREIARLRSSASSSCCKCPVGFGLDAQGFDQQWHSLGSSCGLFGGPSQFQSRCRISASSDCSCLLNLRIEVALTIACGEKTFRTQFPGIESLARGDAVPVPAWRG